MAIRRAQTTPFPLPNREGLFTLGEAAAYLHIAAGTLRNWAAMKKIEYVKVGKFMRFTKAALDRFIAQQTVAAEEPEG